MDSSKLGHKEQKIISAIKSLTENRAYAIVEIVIRAGSIELVQISEKIKLDVQREEPEQTV